MEQELIQFGGVGLAAIVIILQYKFFTNHSKHLTDNIEKNTAATIKLGKFIDRLIAWLDVERKKR